MFARILEHTGPLGLSEAQARQLLGTVVALILSPERGGPDAFMADVRAQGMDAQVDTWLAPGPNARATPDQAEAVFGRETLERMVVRTGLPFDRVREAVAAILPEAVHELSEHGDLPAGVDTVPHRVHGGVGDLQHYLDEVAHWGRAAVNAGAATLGASIGVVPDAPAMPLDEPEERPPSMRPTEPADGRSHLVPWLAIAVAIALALLLLRTCERPSPTATHTEPTARPAPASPASS